MKSITFLGKFGLQIVFVLIFQSSSDDHEDDDFDDDQSSVDKEKFEAISVPRYEPGSDTELDPTDSDPENDERITSRFFLDLHSKKSALADKTVRLVRREERLDKKTKEVIEETRKMIEELKELKKCQRPKRAIKNTQRK